MARAYRTHIWKKPPPPPLIPGDRGINKIGNAIVKPLNIEAGSGLATFFPLKCLTTLIVLLLAIFTWNIVYKRSEKYIYIAVRAPDL